MAIPDWIGLNHVFKAFTKTKHIFQERNLKVFQLCSDPNDVFHLCLIRILVMAQLQMMLSERASDSGLQTVERFSFSPDKIIRT